MAALDAAAVLDRQRAVWNDVSAGWLRWEEAFEAGARRVTDRLLELAGVRAGAKVLDIGSGIGNPALAAAAAVGGSGRVVGIDLAPEMVAIARSRADGLPVDFRVGAVEHADLGDGPFDAALARWSLMFAADRVALLDAVAQQLAPGGVLAAAVWGTPQQVPMISLAFRVISRHLALGPPPPGPGPFTMSDAGALQSELAAAGYADVAVEELAVPFRLSSVDEFARFSRDVLPPGMRALLRDRLGTEDDPALWAEFADAAAPYAGPGGRLDLTSTSLVVRAVARGSR